MFNQLPIKCIKIEKHLLVKYEIVRQILLHYMTIVILTKVIL